MLNQSVTAAENVKLIAHQRWLFLLILMLMSTAGLVGSDVYLPTLPAIGKALQHDPHAMQLTLGIYLFGLSIGQLILGPLTDRFGRKKLLVLGMFVYLFASVSCAFSVTYSQMLVSRFIQAIGACSGLIIGRAIVGDLFDAKEAGKIFSTIFPFVGMSPAISPVIGGFIGYYFGWQATFLFVGLFALTVAILAVYFLPETLSEKNRQSLHLLKVISAYPKLFFNKKFIAYVSVPCTAYIAYFAYIAQSPFIFHANGFGERAIGAFYISLSLTYVLGNLTGRRLLNSFELDQVIYVGFVAFNLGGLLLLLAGMIHLPLYMMVASVSILTFGNGFLIPLGTAGVISSFSKSTGYASGLLGFLQLGVAALSSSLVGPLSKNSVLNLGIYIFVTTLLGIILFAAFNKKSEGGC
ncbi:multidrug effflux MFS transporter [Aquicella lusitana]|uniref:Bcr/CflA family efflux transporter n=1 Tax=Aquicella lusitana TaxID=254246 RepID=A0A370G121_9COXI|nr:multidrug effflux MFS transporter [Aquicella lusitana]RDI37587.1 DHA1 family bicyclomycin/chloramphenicol resistance-like MFS transporter [Aquicella lusitana]VVC73902.1 Inner membrane transport protein YdhC [Aquicella lusitana]